MTFFTNQKFKLIIIYRNDVIVMVSIPCDTLWETLMLLVFISSNSPGLRIRTNVVQKHLKFDALPETIVIPRPYRFYCPSK